MTTNRPTITATPGADTWTAPNGDTYTRPERDYDGHWFTSVTEPGDDGDRYVTYYVAPHVYAAFNITR